MPSRRPDPPTTADERSRSAPGGRPPTKWGDREQRRVDILDAARERIEGGSYLALNMRDLAAAAGLSPATLYSYFATKEELFVTLYVEAIRRHTADIRPGCAEATDLVGLLEHVLRDYLELYRSYGRHFTLWSSLRADADPARGPFPGELIAELRQVSREHS